ncbi:MAG: CRISPR-associated helicase Cas3' [Fimbriimonadaceae bacterium]|nr:CRISPR-associated helicase Cas3' [Fimbriimonadaceae bacterium]
MGLSLGKEYFRLWAKTDPNGLWHSLPYHLLDVAATAEVLWERLPERSRTVAVRQFPSLRMARITCIFLAACHDIGKANRYFQGQVDQFREALKDLSVSSERVRQKHGQATNAYMLEFLKGWGWSPIAARSVAVCVGGHHGYFVVDHGRTALGIHKPPWTELSFELLEDLARVLDFEEGTPEPKNHVEFVGWLAGFVSVADWLGSHEKMVGFKTTESDLGDYLYNARKRAVELLDDLRFYPSESTSRRNTDQILSGYMPNAMQSLSERISQEGFGVAIIESPTGEGKTEAAFILSEPDRSNGEGLYFALPTMATANGLFDRVKGFLSSPSDQTTRRLHSQAWLYAEDVTTHGNSNDQEQRLIAEDWFSGSKRGLLAQYGVGTIDQALIASLRAKHFFVRLFALAGKMVVIDEVHAYDVYMSGLLTRLMEWLRVFSCRVVLLSATLPSSKRSELLRAWGVESWQQAAYPCITWTTPDGLAKSETFSCNPRKPLSIRYFEGIGHSSVQAGVHRILDRVLTSGGTGALLFNTVNDAQSAYEILKSYDEAEGINLFLFHARYTVDDRDAIERKVLNNFGKNGLRIRPAIVVATQVVEQSLDLDFDHMISELAPIDLLIQRAGRLHRHKRDRYGKLLCDGAPDQRDAPVLEVLKPMTREDGLPDFRNKVYDWSILQRTDILLSKEVLIDEPKKVASFIEIVYDEEPLCDERPGIQERLRALEAEHKMKEEDLREIVCAVGIPSPFSEDSISLTANDHPDPDEAGSKYQQFVAKTRIESLPTVSIVISYKDRPAPEGILSQEDKRALVLKTVKASLPQYQLNELLKIPIGKGWDKTKALRDSRLAVLDENGCFETESHRYTYDSEIGLRWSKKNG